MKLYHFVDGTQVKQCWKYFANSVQVSVGLFFVFLNLVAFILITFLNIPT